MGRYRSRSRSRSYSPVRRKRYEEPSDGYRSHGGDRSSPTSSGLLVRNISLHARPEDLRTPFERFGPIKDVYLPKNYYTGEPRGFGFVKFRYAEDAAEAKQQLNHTVIGGREISIVFAEENRKTPQDMRRVTRGRGNYRRRSPLRSPRHRYRSYSRSPSPSGRYSRFRGRRARDGHSSPRRSRSMSRSVSPCSERNYRSNQRPLRQSRSISRSLSPCDERDYKSNNRSPNQKDNGETPHDKEYARSRSQSPRFSSLPRSRS